MKYIYKQSYNLTKTSRSTDFAIYALIQVNKSQNMLFSCYNLNSNCTCSLLDLQKFPKSKAIWIKVAHNVYSGKEHINFLSRNETNFPQLESNIWICVLQEKTENGKN